MRKFITDKGPFIRSADEKINSTNRMMIDVLIALVPIIIFGWVLNGLMPFISHQQNAYYMLKPLINVICGAVFSLLLEGLYFFFFKTKYNLKEALKSSIDSFSIIPGVILALLLPSRINILIILYGCFFANIVFKMLFGGLGHNIFNPALIGYAICGLTFSGAINDALNVQTNIIHSILNITSSATPLTVLETEAASIGSFMVSREVVLDQFGNLLKLFIGFKSGSLGETSGLLCLVGFIYMLVRKVINWRVPVFYVGTVFILTWIVGIVNHIEGPLLGIWFPTYNILVGGLLFGAVFMATEPVTTPKTPNGKIIFAVGLGVFTVLFRLIGMYSEGVCTALLFMCLFTPIIDRFAAKHRGPILTYKTILPYIGVFLLFGLIAVYVVFKTRSIPKDELAIIESVSDMLGGGF